MIVPTYLEDPAEEGSGLIKSVYQLDYSQSPGEQRLHLDSLSFGTGAETRLIYHSLAYSEEKGNPHFCLLKARISWQPMVMGDHFVSW